MAPPAQPFQQANDLLQKLKLGSPAKSGGKLESSSSHLIGLPKGNGDAAYATFVSGNSNNHAKFEGIVDSGIYYAPNTYLPHGYVYDYSQGRYESPVPGEWEEYPSYVGIDGVEIPQPGFYGENGPVVIHQPGFSFTSQPSYGPYSSASQMPTMGADGQLYGPAFQYRGPIYQQALPPPGAPYFTPIIESEGPATTGVRTQVSDGSSLPVANSNVLPLGPRPSFPLPPLPPHGPYPRGVIPLNLKDLGPQDARVAFDSSRSIPSLADIPKNSNRQPRPGNPGTVQITTSQLMPGVGHPIQHRPLKQPQVGVSASQPHRPNRTPSPSLGPGSIGRGYPPFSRGVLNFARAGRGRGSGGHLGEFGANGNGRTWVAVEKNKVGEKPFEHARNGSNKSNGSLNGQIDVPNEQNKGPRVLKTRNQRLIPLAVSESNCQNGQATANVDITKPPKDQYSPSNFTTSYDNARFFVIKSYSEDDVHKSIKYQVWASTSNGNKRLDGSYQEAQAKASGKQGNCPVFLFFSVNASGQFCGLAEMIGPVDFTKSVDYWQQDKWSGQFPVKWHMIKDIPNSQFRHIILENNDNKPVTNSRDTQEIKFEQGIEMLNIFKRFSSKTSILDDFPFYDNRQKAMQDKKIRQQAQQQRHQGRSGDAFYQKTSEVSTKTKAEKENENFVNGSAIPNITLNSSATSGPALVPTMPGLIDRSMSKGEFSMQERSSDNAPKKVAEKTIQRKLYSRSLREGKVENGSSAPVPQL